MCIWYYYSFSCTFIAYIMLKMRGFGVRCKFMASSDKIKICFSQLVFLFVLFGYSIEMYFIEFLSPKALIEHHKL